MNNHSISTGNPNNIISKYKGVDIKSQVMGCCQDAISILLDQFGYYYDATVNLIDAALLSDCLLSIFNIGNTVFTEFAKIMIEYDLDAAAFRGKQLEQQVIVVFYDGNVSPEHYIEFAHRLQYASTNLKDLK